MSPTAAATLRAGLLISAVVAVELIGQYVDQRDRGAFLGGLRRYCPPDTPRGPGHQHDLVRQTSSQCCLLNLGVTLEP